MAEDREKKRARYKRYTDSVQSTPEGRKKLKQIRDKFRQSAKWQEWRKTYYSRPEVIEAMKNRQHKDYQRYASKPGNKEAIAERKRIRWIEQKYNLTSQQLNAMIDLQDGRCAACRTPFSWVLGERPCVDHCHTTQQQQGIIKIRGILCHRCNRTLGHAGDNPKILRSLAKYLERAANTTVKVTLTDQN